VSGSYEGLYVKLDALPGAEDLAATTCRWSDW
jgi:hypothetical protein